MTQQATISGEVNYTPGDGAPGVGLPMPNPISHASSMRPSTAPSQINQSEDSPTLSWTADNDAAGSAAMPHDEFERYVREGKITLETA